MEIDSVVKPIELIVKDSESLQTCDVEVHFSTRASVYRQEKGVSGSLICICRFKLSCTKDFPFLLQIIRLSLV